jgi:hypothetical protein
LSIPVGDAVSGASGGNPRPSDAPKPPRPPCIGLEEGVSPAVGMAPLLASLQRLVVGGQVQGEGEGEDAEEPAGRGLLELELGRGGIGAALCDDDKLSMAAASAAQVETASVAASSGKDGAKDSTKGRNKVLTRKALKQQASVQKSMSRKVSG